MKKTTKLIFILIVTPLFLTLSCKKNEETTPEQLTEIQKTNKFIWEITYDYYLWYEHIPSTLDYKTYEEPFNMFKDMVYEPDDRWSFLTDNYPEILNSFNGVTKSMGYKLKLFLDKNETNIYAFIEYVYENTPASQAELKRGDIIVKVDGTTLDKNNYSDLLNQETIEISLASIENEQIIETGVSKTITAEEITTNPVLQTKVLEVSGIKIGYLLYDQFIEDFFTDFENAIVELKNQQIDELVLDLRFNAGGYLTTCEKIAGLLAPESAMEDVFLKYEYNNKLQEYFIQNEGYNSENLMSYIPNMTNNMNLNKLYILTSSGTASASEMIITGLSPYMDIILIGETTHGKYTAASLFYDRNDANNLWGIYLVISKMLNSLGEMNFKDGFIPDYEAIDDYQTPMGTVDEPLLAKAIEVITGQPAKTSCSELKYKSFGRIDKPNFIQDGILIIDNNFNFK